MKALFLFLAVLVLSGITSSCSTIQSETIYKRGKNLFKTTFDPEQNFAGEIIENSLDELIMTVTTSRRDDYLPDYSLAIAYRVVPVSDDKLQGQYIGRMLRVKKTDEPFGFSYKPENLDWMEVNLWDCNGAIAAMDNVRKSDWQPDIHYSLLDVEDREIISHPAEMKVTMTGNYVTTTYKGWRLANGVPAAVREMVSVLEPCWKPSNSPTPWEK